MKRHFFTLIFVLTTMLTFAQTSEHLSFKNVPIDGTLDEYVAKMKQSGFTMRSAENSGLLFRSSTMHSTENGVAILKGDFAAYKNCIVSVVTLKGKDLVSKVTVTFPSKDTWSGLSGIYFDLKQMLTEKYGKPSDVVEKFDVPSYSQPKDDNDKIFEVKMNRCEYYTIFETAKGSIRLTIMPVDMECYVTLAYIDKINSEIIRAKAIDDL
jgi:hypothetical protein